MNFIRMNGVRFEYPNSDFKLSIEELAFPKTSRTAIIGPSGFGKTTLLNLISGISIPEKGQVDVNGTHINTLSDSDRRTFRLMNIGFVFQDFRLLDYLTVLDNMLLPFRINKALKLNEQVREHAVELSAMLGIKDQMSKYPDKLSQGERQRVAICRALIHKPPLILADEPTGNLDPENKRVIMKMLFDCVSHKGSTLITVTHDHELLSGFDRTIDFKEIYVSK
jgi:putative ABC transport system ATP-binding protein